MPATIVDSSTSAGEMGFLAGAGGCTACAGGHPRVDPGVDLPADLVEEGVDDRGLIVRAQLAVNLGGGADLFR